MNREPATIITTITAFIAAIMTLLVAFNIHITEDQRTAILTTAGAFFALLLAVGPIIRGFVWSKDTVEKKVDQAYEATPGVDAKPKV